MRNLSVIILLVLIASCTNDNETVFGLYKSNNKDVECNILYMSKNGKFYQYILNDTTIITNTGKWGLLYDYKYSFSNYLYYDNLNKKVDTINYKSCVIGSSEIVFDPDIYKLNFHKAE